MKFVLNEIQEKTLSTCIQCDYLPSNKLMSRHAVFRIARRTFGSMCTSVSTRRTLCSSKDTNCHFAQASCYEFIYFIMIYFSSDYEYQTIGLLTNIMWKETAVA
jgi:hypothetical protein